MKKIIILLISFSLICMSLSACNKIDKNKDAFGYNQFVVEFSNRLFYDTHNSNSSLRYYPENPKLQNRFGYGEKDVEFSAEYQKEKIVYTVTNVTDDRIAEMKTFENIFNIYYESWSNFAEKTDIGELRVSEPGDVETLEYYVSGVCYKLTSSPLADPPTIVFETVNAF